MFTLGGEPSGSLLERRRVSPDGMGMEDEGSCIDTMHGMVSER